ncbi:MAG: N-glycosylase/DNA lyase [Candidatus Bathyarchaeia archaeon]
MNESRIEELSNTICKIPIDAFNRIDVEEPEYKTFDNLRKTYGALASSKLDCYLALLGIGTGLIDYQQKNPGKSVWQPLERIVFQMGVPSTIDEARSIHLRLASSSRFRTVKAARIKRMYESGFASWFEQSHLSERRRDPYNTWRTLADHMHDPMDKKTIVMAMKAFDMETLAVTKNYLPFPPNIPIVVDSRIAYVSLSSGIIFVEKDTSIDDIASRYRTQIINAWSQVIRGARRVLGNELNAFRLDSLIWQAGEYRNPDSLLSYLRRMRIPSDIASGIVSQILWKEV